MSEADKDGRIAQMVSDMHTTLAMSLNQGAYEMRQTLIKALVDAAPIGDDGPCHGCGQSYPTWRAADSLWNRVMGGEDAKGDPGGMLCPNCFLRTADLVAPERGAWLLTYPAPPVRDSWPSPKDAEWGAWCALMWDVTKAVRGLPNPPLFSGRNRITGALWDAGYRPTPERVRSARAEQQAAIDADNARIKAEQSNKAARIDQADEAAKEDTTP